jgi:DNA (cytosine-5)-methyltransferase 1
MPRTFIDLFAGIGGFHWALEKLDYECLLAVEKDKAASEVYAKNFPECAQRMEGDIRTITRKKPVDENTIRSASEIRAHLNDKLGIERGGVGIICGGFPCQPFSKSGGQEGDKDVTRGTLFHDILQLTEALEPQYLILENVRNLAGPKHERTLKTIIQSISDLGYVTDTTPIVLSPHELNKKYGSPQVRERVFILAHRKGVKGACHPAAIREEVDRMKNGRKRSWKARSILDDGKCKTRPYNIGKQEEAWLEAWERFLKITKGERLPGFPIWTEVFHQNPPRLAGAPQWKQDFLKKNHAFYLHLTHRKSRKQEIDKWLKLIRTFPASRRKFEWQANSAFDANSKRTLKKLLIQLRPSGVRVKPATHYPALVAITQTTIVGPKVRKPTHQGPFRYISPKEAAKLQGMHKIKFGDQSDAKSYKQLGNAVNVGVIRYLAERLTGEAPCGRR